MKKWLYRGLILLVVLVGGGYSANLVIEALSHESTDNAYITGVIVPVSAEIQGRVTKVYVEDNQTVAAGDPLIDICQDDYLKILKEKGDAVSRLTAERHELEVQVIERQKVLERARANGEVARAEEILADKEQRRYQKLIDQEAVSQSQYDNVQSQWKIVRAKTEAAEAAVAEAEVAITVLEAKLKTQTFRIKEAETAKNLAELNLKRTVVRAPVPGRVAKKNVDAGKYVQTGQPLLAIVQDDTWVVANFKETQIKKMALGQPVRLEIDAYPHLTFKGRIESMQQGTGSVFSLLPPENATGNFIKIVQRVPVKIVFEPGDYPAHILRPGLSVVATVDVSASVGAAIAEKK